MPRVPVPAPTNDPKKKPPASPSPPPPRYLTPRPADFNPMDRRMIYTAADLAAVRLELARVRAELMAERMKNMDAMEGAGRPNVAPPDGAPWYVVLAELEQCSTRWDGDARILGNIRARDIGHACRAALAFSPLAIDDPDPTS